MTKRILLTRLPGDSDPDDAANARRAADILRQIREIYFKTGAATIERDFDRAIDLLKAIPALEDRQRATVYMEGLAEMRKEWKRRSRKRKPPT